MNAAETIAAGYKARHTDGVTKYAGVMFIDGEKILLLRRSAIETTRAGFWALPGGHIDPGETAEHGARRETLEEIGKMASGLEFIAQDKNGFSLFACRAPEFTPILNSEHDAWIWADINSLPSPLHPRLEECFKEMAMDSAREVDGNGFVTIQRNPITRVGVFKYSGRSIPGGDPGAIYSVYRPAEELASAETIKSFRGLPITDDHPTMLLGPNHPTEAKGAHGTTLEDIIFDGNILYAPIRIFSETLKELIARGKKALSAGYKCRFEKSSGFFNGLAYDYIQRDIRGNHLSVVTEGRSGPDIAVLDSMAFDHFDLALDQTETKETEVADEDKAKPEGESKEGGEAKEEKAAMTLEQVVAMLEEIMPQVQSLQKMVASMNSAGEAEGMDDDKKEKEGDDAEAKDKKGAMDAAEIADLKSRLSKVEARSEKTILSAITARDKIVKDVTPFIGTFDHADKTTDEVVAYACDKLEIKVEKDQQVAALTGFLAAKKSAGPVGFALDSSVKTGGLLDKTLNGAKA